jgi:Arc/MetJ-type ribon-helix-helix transcriptional regulator
MMSTPLRNIRINDELWFSALAKAENEGRNLSEVIRELLSRWVERPDERRQAMGTDWGPWGDHWVQLFDAGQWKRAYDELLQDGYYEGEAFEMLQDAMRRSETTPLPRVKEDLIDGPGTAESERVS